MGLGKRKGLHADFLLTHSFELRWLQSATETGWGGVVFRFVFKAKEKAATIRFVTA